MLSEACLLSLVEQNKVVPFRFAQSVWILDARAAVYWPEQDCLLVADLHFEKGSYLSRHASPIPRYDSRATLNTLVSLMTQYQPRRVLCLGDSFHDIGAFSRFLPEDAAQLKQLIQFPEEWVWLVGNHDPLIPESIPGTRLHTYPLITQQGKTIHCQHTPDIGNELQIVGHFHPKASYRAGKRRFKGKSLVATQQLMLMPAVGQYTGGLDINEHVLLALAPKSQRQCYLINQQRVIALPPGS